MTISSAGWASKDRAAVEGVRHIPRDDFTAAKAGQPDRSDFPGQPRQPTPMIGSAVAVSKRSARELKSSRGYATFPVTVARYQGGLTGPERVSQSATTTSMQGTPARVGRQAARRWEASGAAARSHGYDASKFRIAGRTPFETTSTAALEGGRTCRIVSCVRCVVERPSQGSEIGCPARVGKSSNWALFGRLEALLDFAE